MKKIMKTVLAAFLITTLILTASVGVFAAFFFTGYDVFEEVAYGEGENNVMDIYIPKTAYGSEECGCVLFIHGGSWTGGDKSEEALRSRLVANGGYIAATMNYTLFTKENADVFSAEVVLLEIEAALTRIVDFANEKGVTVTKAATAGYSAGAHLSMLYSYSRHEDAPIEIVFTANMAGPSDFSSEIWGESVTAIGERLVGKAFKEDSLSAKEKEELLTFVAPVSFIDADTPPSLFAYGGKDTTVSDKNGESIKKKFDEAHVHYDYILFPDSNHAMISDPIKRIEYDLAILDYCEKYFK